MGFCFEKKLEFVFEKNGVCFFSKIGVLFMRMFHFFPSKIAVM